MEKIPEDFETKKEEFFRRVDAGDFDHIILARADHRDDQDDERDRRMKNPTTPDELIDSAINDEEEREFHQIFPPEFWERERKNKKKEYKK